MGNESNVVYILKENQKHWYGVPTSKLNEWLTNLSPGDLVIYPGKVKVVEAKLVDCEAKDTINEKTSLIENLDDMDEDLSEEPF